MKKKGSFLMTVGVLLILAAAGLSGYNIYESTQAQIVSDRAVEKMTEVITDVEPQTVGEQPDYVTFPEKEMPTIEIDGERYIGMLEIPDLNMTLPVAAGEWSYAKLRKAPCRYSGSVYQDDLVVAGHNYRSHFSKLKSLDIGSEIRFIDIDGNVFYYSIGWIDILQSTDVEEMTDAAEWDMTLFTCTYGGKERYTIRCIRTEE